MSRKTKSECALSQTKKYRMPIFRTLTQSEGVAPPFGDTFPLSVSPAEIAEAYHIRYRTRHEKPMTHVIASDERYIYVIDEEGSLQMSPERHPCDGMRIVHSTLSSKAISAGIATFHKAQYDFVRDSVTGEFKEVIEKEGYFTLDNYSGHFRPCGPHLAEFTIEVFAENGARVDSFNHFPGSEEFNLEKPPKNFIAMSDVAKETATPSSRVKIIINENITKSLVHSKTGESLGDCVDVNVEIQTHEGVKSFPLELFSHELSQQLHTLSDTDHCEIIFSKTNQRVILPENINKNLIQFFKEYKPKWNDRFCCLNFACELALGRDVGPVVDYSAKIFDEKKMQVGDVVLLMPRETPDINSLHALESFHVAVYIGNQQFLSLLGTSGNLAVMSLAQMNKAYSTKEAYVMSHLQRHNPENNAPYAVEMANPTKKPPEMPAQNPLSSLIPAIFSSQLHGETHSSQSAIAIAEQDQHDSEEDTHTTQKIEKELTKQALKIKSHNHHLDHGIKNTGFVANALAVHQHTIETYPNDTSEFNAVCSAAQVLVEAAVESAGAGLGTAIATVLTEGIPTPATTWASKVGGEAAKQFVAKPIGNAVNDGLHYVFGTQKPRAVSAHPSRRSTASSSFVPENIQKMYRGETQNRQNQYEQHVSGVNSSARNQAKSHRKYFAKTGMPEAALFGSADGNGIVVYGTQVSNEEYAKSLDPAKRASFEAFVRSRLPFATAEAAETHAKPVVVRRSQSQPKSQRSAFHLQRQFLDETISSPAITTTATSHAAQSPAKNQLIARTNTAASLLNTAQLDDLKIVLQKTNVALRERQEAAQIAQYNAQRQVEMLSLAGEVCSLASRVCRYCGDGDTAQFFSSTFSLFAGFFSFVTTGSPLGIIMAFAGFFMANRAAEEARRFAMMIAAASRSTENMRDDVITEIREFQRLAQNEIRLVGAKVAEVLAAQNQLHQSQTQVFSGLAIFQKSLGEYFEKTNAYMHVLATRPLKTACDNLLSYLDNPKKAVSLSLEKIQDYANELEFWITSRLHHRVVNYTVYLNLPESEIISILSSQPHTLLIMPSFVAGRAQSALGEKVLHKFLSLPPMIPYFATIRLFYRTLEKHPEFLTDDKCESVFAHIQETLTTFSELLTLLKNNEADIQSCKNMPENERAIIVNMIRAVDLYQAVIAEMKSSITYYQKRLCYLTDPLQQLDMLARESFDKPNSQNGFWKKNEAKSNQAEVCYVISRSHFYDDPQDANTEAVRDSEREFLNKFSRRRIKVVAVTINHEEMFQVILPAKSVPNILPSIPNKCASFFFNSTHQRDLIPEMASSTTRQLQ